MPQHPGMRAIRIDTFASLLKHGYGLDCYCPGCQRWASTDLAMLVRNGLGDRPAHRCRPRCRKCGELGRWQVKAPVPTVAGSPGLDGGAPKPRLSNVLPLRPR